MRSMAALREDTMRSNRACWREVAADQQVADRECQNSTDAGAWSLLRRLL